MTSRHAARGPCCDAVIRDQVKPSKTSGRADRTDPARCGGWDMITNRDILSALTAYLERYPEEAAELSEPARLAGGHSSAPFAEPADLLGANFEVEPAMACH